jgi:hypothetical protein
VGPPEGGVTSWQTLEETKECHPHYRELEPNLASGLVAIGVREKGFAVARYFRSKTRNEGLVAFGGYDTLTHTIGTSYGVGKAALYPLRVFPRKDDWLVTWFDPQGLVYTKAGWAPTTSAIKRIGALTTEQAEHIALAPTVEGPLLATAPLSGATAQQLGLFLFAPADEGADTVKAIGATHHASRPEHPAVVQDRDGYVVAWEDQPTEGGPRQIAIARFDSAGREVGLHQVLSTPGRAASHPTLASSEAGLAVAWVEKEGDSPAIVARIIDRTWQITTPASRIDRGSSPALAATKDGVLLVFLRQATDKPSHVAAVLLSGNGHPADHGILVSDVGKGKNDVLAPPVVAIADDGRAGVAFTMQDGMRSQLRTMKIEGCLGPEAKRDNGG